MNCFEVGTCLAQRAGRIRHSSTDTMQKKTLTVVPINVPIWWVKIVSKLVRNERYLVRVFRLDSELNSQDTAL
jgi:hypothetical protein